MTVNVILTDESKPAKDIIEPLLSTRQSQIERGRVFLTRESQPNKVTTSTGTIVPGVELNRRAKMSVAGLDRVGVASSVTFSSVRGQVSTMTLSMRSAAYA